MAHAYPSTQTLQELAGLYVGFFGRAADAEGYQFWANTMTDHISALTAFGYTADQAQAIAQQDVANKFANSGEFKSQYGALNPTQQVTKVYNNVLNREPDAEGLAYWVNLLSTGSTLPAVVTGIINSCLLQGDTTADGRLVLNKISVSRYFAEDLSSNNIAIAETAFNTVTEDDATVPPADRSLLIQTANQVELTVRPDTFRGISGNNTFDGLGAVNAQGQLVQTLQNGDSLIGSANGTNTLKANLFESSVTPTLLQNINWLELTNQGTAGSTLNIVNSDAVDIVSFNNLEGNFTLAGVRDAGTNYRINNTQAVVVSVTASATAVVGADDTAIIDITNSSVVLDLDTRYENANIESIAGIGTLNQVATNFAGDIQLEGSGNFSLVGSTGESISATSVDATLLTGTFATQLGSVATTVVGGSGQTTITGGSGAADVTFGNNTNLFISSSLADVSAAAAIIGGTGTDTLRFGANLNNSTADGNFARVNTFETLTLDDSTNTIGVSTNFFTVAGFDVINGGASADAVVIYGATDVTATVNGGLGNDTLTFSNTAGGTITIAGVETVGVTDAGNQTDTINISGTAAAAVGVDLGGGTDTVNLLAGAMTTLTVSNVEVVNATANATTGNLVILGAGSTTTVQGGSAALTVDASASTNGNSILFGASNDTLILNTLASLSAEATVVGSSGTDTLRFGANLNNSTADGNFARVNTFETLTLNDSTNTIGVGQNFFTTAGFNQINGGASADAVVIYGATDVTATVNGGLGNDTLTFSDTAGGTVTILSVETVSTSSAGNQSDTIIFGAASGSLTAQVGVGGGIDTVTNLNTNGATVRLSEVENYFGNMGNETITLFGTTAATTINGGGGNDLLTLGTNLLTTSVSAGGNTGTFTIAGSTASETLAIIGAGTYALTAVDTVAVSSGVSASLAAELVLSTGGSTYAYTLASGNTGSFTFASSNTTGGVVVLTVNASTGSQTININQPLPSFIAETANTLIVAGGGYDTITLAAAGSTGVVKETVQLNLGNLSAGYNTANSFVITNFNASTGADTINLTGATLRNANGAQIILNTNTISGTGLSNTNVFTTGLQVGTFITGDSTILANLASTDTQTGVIFESTATLSGNLTTQAGINSAADYISANIGVNGTVSGQNAIIIVNDSTTSALFQFTETGGSGISTTELKLIGVVNGTSLTASNFS